MPNLFQKPSVIVNTALGILDRELVLAKLIWSDAVSNWAGVANETVSVRVPGRMKARTRALRGGTPLTIDTLNETLVPLVLNTDIYSGIGLTDENLTLDILDIGYQVLTPQMLAVAEELESAVGRLMANAAYVKTITVDPDNPHLAVLDARQFLNDHYVPMSNRFGALGSGVERAFLSDPQLTKASYAGDASAFRDAQIGSVYGTEFSVAQGLPAQVGVIAHKTAFVQGLRAPVVPDGASFGQSQTYLGLAMRWIRDYDPLNVTDRSLFSTWYGNNVVPDLIDPTDSNSGTHFVRAVRLELQVASVAVTPATKALAVGADFQLAATATYADGSTRDVTTDPSVTWTSATPSHATVGAQTGIVHGVGAGTANVKATYQGTDSGNCAVTVS